MAEDISLTLNQLEMGENPTRPPFKVLIIGAGLGGLTLAQSLKNSRIEFKIFERDKAADRRPQGYRIKVHGETTTALRSVLSPELWRDFEETCGETVLGETTINSLNGSIVASRKGLPDLGDKDLYTVDRSMLRKVLLQGLEDVLHWGKEFDHYEIQEEKIVAHFKDGTMEEGCLLIGADGFRSKVTKQYLPLHRTLDVEGCCIYGKTFFGSELAERFPNQALRWMTLCQDEPPVIQSVVQGANPVTLLLEPMRFQNREKRDDLPEDYVYWVLLFKKQLFASTDEELKKLLQRPGKELSLFITTEWHPSIRALLELQDPRYTIALRIFSADPRLGYWAPNPRITLLGDAVHLMSPAGGVGACTAIKDAWVLGKILAKDGLSKGSIGEYERTMREYTEVSLQRSFLGGKNIFNQTPFELCREVDIWNV